MQSCDGEVTWKRDDPSLLGGGEEAVRSVRQLHKELGSDVGTIGWVAEQLGNGTESLRD